MSHRVDLTTAAARQVKKLPRPMRERVLDAVEDLAEDPRPHGAKKLVGEKIAWRIRIGDHRVIYDVRDTELTVTVVRAAHRREVYDRRGPALTPAAPATAASETADVPPMTTMSPPLCAANHARVPAPTSVGELVSSRG